MCGENPKSLSPRNTVITGTEFLNDALKADTSIHAESTNRNARSLTLITHRSAAITHLYASERFGVYVFDLEEAALRLRHLAIKFSLRVLCNG